MLARPHTLSLITTHQCTAACEHCCFHCTPKIKKAIPSTRLHALIDEARGVPSIRIVVFTGGECFLLRHELDRLISRASGYGFSTRCVTNCYWASSEKVAELRISELIHAGLKELNLSTGTFHSKYVPVARVVYAARASVRAGIVTLINVEVFPGDEFNVAEITCDSELAAYLRNGRLVLQRNVWIENGGKTQLPVSRTFSRFDDLRISGCKTVLGVVSVTPDQKLMACCGLHMEKIEELQLGSVAHQTLADALAGAPDDLLKIWIHVAGPERVLNFVKLHQPDYALPLDSPHPCETCLHLYRDPIANDVIRNHYKEIETPILNMYFASLANQEIGARTFGNVVAIAADD